MAVITDYNSLVSAVQQATEDDAVELLNYIPIAIDLAEEILYKDLDISDFDTATNGNLISGTNTIIKPNGYKFAKHFIISTADGKKLLKKRLEDFIDDYWPNSSTQGEPKFYADQSATYFMLAPTPDMNYVYSIKYSTQPLKLSSSNTTNYFIQQCKDILFFAVMVEIAKFTKAWSQVQIWESQYVKEVGAWNSQEARKRRDNGETPTSSTGPNDLTYTQ